MQRASQTAIAWQVYETTDPLRKPGTVMGATGPLIGSVTSWEELTAMAAEQDVQFHQIEGSGLVEMEAALGPAPE